MGLREYIKILHETQVNNITFLLAFLSCEKAYRGVVA